MNDVDCRRACRALALGTHADRREREWVAEHCAACADCAALDAELLASLPAATPDLPDDAFFATQSARIAAALAEEPAVTARSAARPTAWSAGLRRVVLPLALAAGVALFVQFGMRSDVVAPQPGLLEIGFSEAEVEGAMQSAFFASDPLFSFSPPADIGDLSDAELEDLHGIFGEQGLG